MKKPALDRFGWQARLDGHSAWAMAGLRWLGSATFAFADLQMNSRVLAASLLIAGATPVAFGLLPALRLAPPDPEELRDGARAAGATRRGRRLRNLIVALQTGAAMVLMVLFSSQHCWRR